MIFTVYVELLAGGATHNVSVQRQLVGFFAATYSY
jgi:hypothetical protein